MWCIWDYCVNEVTAQIHLHNFPVVGQWHFLVEGIQTAAHIPCLDDPAPFWYVEIQQWTLGSLIPLEMPGILSQVVVDMDVIHGLRQEDSELKTSLCYIVRSRAPLLQNTPLLKSIFTILLVTSTTLCHFKQIIHHLWFKGTVFRLQNVAADGTRAQDCPG